MRLIFICPEYDERAIVDIQYIPVHTLDNPNNYLKGIFECSLIRKGCTCPDAKQCPLYLNAPNETSNPYEIYDFCK